MVVLGKELGDARRETAVLGRLLGVVRTSESLVALVGRSNVMGNSCIKFMGSWYREKLVEYNAFDLRYPQKCVSVVFGSMDLFCKTEINVAILKGTEHRDWMASQHAMRRAVVTGDLSIPSLVELLANVVCACPLIVSYLKETGRKTGGDSLMV